MLVKRLCTIYYYSVILRTWLSSLLIEIYLGPNFIGLTNRVNSAFSPYKDIASYHPKLKLT